MRVGIEVVRRGRGRMEIKTKEGKEPAEASGCPTQKRSRPSFFQILSWRSPGCPISFLG